MGVLVGEGVDFVILVVLLVDDPVEGGVGVQEAMVPVRDKVLDEVHQHHLSKQQQQAGEPIVLAEPVPAGGNRNHRREDHHLVQEQVGHCLPESLAPVLPLPRPAGPFVGHVSLVETAEAQVPRQVDQEAEDCRASVDCACGGDKPERGVLDVFWVEAVAEGDAGLHDGEDEQESCQHPHGAFLLVAVALDLIDLSQSVNYIHFDFINSFLRNST